MTKVCDCGRVFTDDESSGDTCFPCKLKGVGFTFAGGGGYGREAFHERTNSEVAREIIEGAKKDGREIEYVGRRWV
jgi:hypothetical protein